VIIQYFETDWREIRARMPQLALAGYDALWCPPPTKGAEGVRDVGFSVYDRFDLGDKMARGTIRTRYGTRDEVVAMTKTAHDFGLRVLFDVVMNHNANPSLIENVGVALTPVPIDQFPGTVPLDYHLLPARSNDGGTTWIARVPLGLGGGEVTIAPHTALNPEDYVAVVPMPAGVSIPGYTHLARAPRIDFSHNSLFEIQNYSLLGLVDFATEQSVNGGGPAQNDGINFTTGLPLPRFVRNPGCPECYPNNQPVDEDIREYLMRWIRWLGEVTDADGFRLDAIKHIPTTFYSSDYPGDPIAFNKVIQDDYVARRSPGAKAQIFGENYSGSIQGDLQPYIQTGMGVLNFPLFFTLQSLLAAGTAGNGDIGQLSFPQTGVQPDALVEYGGVGRAFGVSFVQSHDSAAPDGQPNLGYAFIMTRPGDAVVFFDGNNPDARNFVQPGRPDALGELGSKVITTLVDINNRFARGGMFNRFVDDDVYAYERVVDGTGATLLAILTDNIGADGRVGADGVAHFGGLDPRPLLVTAFPPGTVLVDYTGNSPVHTTTVLDPNSVPADQRARALSEYMRSSQFPAPPGYGLVYAAVPSGPDHGYAMYAPQAPAPPANGARPFWIEQAGQRVQDVPVTLVGAKHTAAGAQVPPAILNLPQVTAPAVDLRVRADALADQVYVRLGKGGVPLAGVQPLGGSPEGLWDGFVPMTRGADLPSGDRLFTLDHVDVSALADGTYVMQARAVAARPGAPIFTIFTVPFLMSRGGGGTPPGQPLDSDGDGVLDMNDNCPKDYNPGQEDFDGDKVGNVCDLCPLTDPGVAVDAVGCPLLSDQDKSALEATVTDILAGHQTVVDFVRQVDALRDR
jgi:alpha-amylase